MVLTAQQQQVSKAQAQAIAARNKQNADFMRYSYEQPELASAQNGNAYVPGGNPLSFLAPVTELAYATRLTVRTNLTFTYTAAATSPYINLTAAAPWSHVKEVEVVFGNTQIKVHPFFEYLATQMRGYNRQWPGEVIGNSVADIQSQIYKSPTIAAGSNTWQTDIDIPLNRIHPASVWGLLPIMGTGTRLQANVTPAAAFVGKDPLENVIDTNGTITAISGTVQLIVWYRDYKSMSTRMAVAPNLAGVPTVQVIKPQEINPLTAGTMNYKRIDNPYEFARLISVVIDGQASSTFCLASNISAYEIDRAENNSSVLLKYDNTNGGMVNYYRQARDQFGQDLPDGVLAFDAMTRNVADPSTMNGDAYLNLGASGFPAARLGFQVGAVSSANVTPRVVTYGTVINRAGIRITN